MIITRGLQELACLWPQDLPFAPVARLMGWQAQTEAVISDTSIRMLVRTHGQIIRQAEQDEVAALLTHPDRSSLQPHLVPATQPRRRAGWPVELSAAVDQALQDGLADPPAGVSRADWERVLHARRQEAALPVATLRQLGPAVQPDQTLVTTDEVLTRALGGRRFWEIRTARVSTPAGTRYLSGTGPALLRQLLVLILICAVRWPAVLVLADGARWIRAWFGEVLAALPGSALILDWWHLCKRCRELASMACRGRKAKAALLRPIGAGRPSPAPSPQSPTRRLPRPIKEERDRRALDQALAGYVMPYRLIFTLLRETGMRVGEVLALNVGDVVLGPGQEGLQVRDPKNRVERVVILGPNSTEKSIRLLRRYIKDRRGFPTTHPLFCSNRTTRLRYGTVLYHWGKLCRRAGLCDETGMPRYTIHQLRHTLATELFEQGLRLETVQRRLGHTDIRTTMGYAEVSDAWVRAELEGGPRW